MPRFRKGTNDHDGDGHKGGSLKGDDMTKKAETKAAPKAPTREKLEAQFAEADAKGAPEQSEEDRIAEIQAGLGVRGY